MAGSIQHLWSLSRPGVARGRSVLGSTSLHALAKRLGLRQAVDAAGDWLRFKLDYATGPCYQPLPWRDVGRSSASRAEGVVSRWEAMLPLIRDSRPRSALDIGCNVGWFSHSLAFLGIPTVGVEGFPAYYRTAIYAAKRRNVENVSILVMTLDAKNARLLPRVDCTLFLSVWHHLVQQYGLPAASSILSDVWQRTDKVLFFEGGENEMGPEFGLPAMVPSARIWFTEYLNSVCPGASNRHLGLHHAGSGSGRVVWRNLFALVRDDTS